MRPSPFDLCAPSPTSELTASETETTTERGLRLLSARGPSDKFLLRHRSRVPYACAAVVPRTSCALWLATLALEPNGNGVGSWCSLSYSLGGGDFEQVRDR